jgi:hypothetical protein
VSSDREVGQLLVTFAGGMFPGMVLAMTLELLLAPLFAVVCFYDQREAIMAQLHDFLADPNARSDPTATPAPPHAGRIANVLQMLDIERTLGFYVFMLLTAYVVAGLVEETTKLWLVQTKCLCNCSKTGRGWLCDPRRLLLKRVGHTNHHVVIVLAVTAAALGFASLENAAFAFASPTFGDRLQVAVLRSLLSLPLHGLCGAITGMRLARALVERTPETLSSAWKQKCWVLYPSVLVHGTFDFQIFLVSSFVSSAAADAQPFLYELLIPSVLSLGMIYVAYRLSQHQWRELESVASGRGQYMHLGVNQEVADDESDEEDDEANAKPMANKRSGELFV